MRAPRRTVWISENDELSDSLDAVYLGTFDGHLSVGLDVVDRFRDLSLDEALAWGRDRARAVYIRFGDSDYYSAGEQVGTEFEPWPPDDLPVFVRGRPSGDEWKDRKQTDPPMAWNVVLDLEPMGDGSNSWSPEIRANWDREARAIKKRAGAMRLSRRAMLEAERAFEAALGEAAHTDTSVIATTGVPAYELKLVVDAPTRDTAVDRAIRSCGSLPAGWTVAGWAEPAA